MEKQNDIFKASRSVGQGNCRAWKLGMDLERPAMACWACSDSSSVSFFCFLSQLALHK